MVNKKKHCDAWGTTEEIWIWFNASGFIMNTQHSELHGAGVGLRMAEN